jgi:large subunit ribosomal protein L24
MKIIKGDQVTILLGKDKGRSGEIIRSLPKKQQVVVKGLNLFKKHLKSQGNQKGGIIEKERPLDVSKVILVCPNCHKTTRVAYKVDKAGDKSRVCRRCHQIIATKTK